MRKTFLFVLSLFCLTLSFAQLKSPGEFLGYELGTRFTPHYKIVNYFTAAVAAAPQMAKLEKYGETNEGRPLLLAIVASPENFANLEEIRKNNLRLTGLLTDKPADVNAPAIVWLSYNVHGNEASSSEVAMKTLYELLTPANTQTKEWLKNVVVIIDPCLNPDGRDRYVNWYTQMEGKYPNADPDSREHNEPWPGGRVNHYNFDLNRDWAWQTQVESQQRLLQYNAWLPQVHCDFHEQYPNNPYYFAPAAEPMHEVITPWQKEFQNTVGKNHARYFDANGWLYFTREEFDLFYPAYGDTYPLYNGAIGMTYEQAGHSPGGLAVALGTGDTLTLKDRIAHHFTTSMSTLEVASKNAAQLVREFKKFYDDARNTGTGEYKTYIVTSDKSNKLDALKTLLANNKIAFGTINKAGLRGYNYFTGKEEAVVTDNYTIAVAANQPKSTLIKVLFEPRSKLSDSVTYDITAWGLPFAYGVKAYAVKEAVAVSSTVPAYTTVLPAANYAYVVGYSSFADAKLLAALLQRNAKIRFSEKDLYVNGKLYPKGALIILRSGNEKIYEELPALFSTYHAEVSSIATGMMDKGFDLGSDKTHLVKKVRVAVLTGEGVSALAAGEIWHLFDQQLNYPVSMINAADLNSSNFKNIDVLILPDSYSKVLADKETNTTLKAWVRQGGKLIALEGAVGMLAANDWGIKIKKDDDKKGDDKKDEVDYSDIKKYESREKESVTRNIPGAIYKVELDNTHPLAFGYPDYYYTLKLSDAIYEFMKDGWNVGVLKKEQQVSGFVGSKLKDKIKDGTVIGSFNMGSGNVVFFADDPVFRSFWENGKLLFSNAVFLVGN